VICNTENEQSFKKQQMLITVIKIWVCNSCCSFELYSDCNFKALKNELLNYIFLRDVTEMSDHQLQFFDIIECHLINTVSQWQFTFQYDGCCSAKRWLSIIDSYFQQTVHIYAKLHMELQHFKVRVMSVPKRVSLDVPLILDSSMPNGNPSGNTL